MEEKSRPDPATPQRDRGLDAIARHDGAAAKAAMRRHLRSGQRHRMSVLANAD